MRLKHILLSLLAWGACQTASAITVSTTPVTSAGAEISVGNPLTVIVGDFIQGSFTITLPLGFSYTTSDTLFSCTGSNPVSCTSPPPPMFGPPLFLQGFVTVPDVSLPGPNVLQGAITASQPANSVAPSATAQVFYGVRGDIVINSPASAPPQNINDQFSLTYAVANGSPAIGYRRFRNTRVTFNVPTQLQFLGGSGAIASCSTPSGSPGGVASCDILQSVATPSVVTENLVLQFRKVAAGAASITHDATSENVDINPANNQGNVLVPAGAPPAADLQMTSVNGAQSGEPGDSVTNRFRVTNGGPANAQSVSVTFATSGTPPATISGVTASPGGLFTCSSSGPNYVCSAGGLTASQSVEFDVLSVLPVGASVAPISATVASLTPDPSTPNNQVDVINEINTQAPRASLQVVKTANNESVSVGQDASFEIVVRNDSSVDAAGLFIEDPSTINMLITGFANASPDLNCRINSDVLSCSQPSLLRGAQARVRVLTRAPAREGTMINDVTVTSNNADTVRARAQTLVFATPPVNLSIDKRDSQDPVAPDGEFDYVLTVSNLAAAANEVVVTDSLPIGVTFVSVNSPSFTCTGSTNIRCIKTQMAASESGLITIRVKANGTGTVRNTANVTSRDADSTPSNNSDSEDTAISASPIDNSVLDLQIRSEDVGGTLSLGSTRNVLFTITNLGNTASSSGRGVQLAVAGSALTLVTSSIGGQACSGNRCALPTLLPGAIATVSAVIRADSQGNGSVNAELLDLDANPSNNRAAVSFVSAQAPGSDLILTATDSADPVQLNTDYEYRLEISNPGPENAAGVRITFTAPPGLEFRGVVGPGTCVVGDATVICTIGDVLVRVSKTIVLRFAAIRDAGAVTVRFEASSSGRELNPANNVVSETTQVNVDSTQIGAIVAPLITDRFARDAQPVIAQICARPRPSLAAQCEAIIDAALARDTPALEQGLRALYPEEVLSQRLALGQQSQTQFNNVDARLNELRSGGGGFSVAGLTLSQGGRAIPIGFFSGMLQDEEPEVGGSGDLISPWGFFANGTISRGEQKVGRDTRGVSSDFDSVQLTTGVDYRISVRTVVGAALGYSDFSSDLEFDSETENRSITFTGYGSHYFTDNWYVDSRLTFGNVSFDTKRRIRFSYRNFSLDELASGSTDGRQLAFAVGTGYHLQKNGWTLTPNFSARYFRSTVDGYTETGSANNGVEFGDQKLNTTQYNLGLQVSRAISLNNGVLAPQFDLSYGSESRNSDFALTARLLAADPNSSFRVRDEEADNSFGSLGLGLVYVMANGKQAYISYRKLFANDSIDRDSINLGARFDF